jgi:hypothetical protein
MKYEVVFPAGQKVLIRLISSVLAIGMLLLLMIHATMSYISGISDWGVTVGVFSIFASLWVLTGPHRRVLRTEGEIIILTEEELGNSKKHITLFPFLIGSRVLYGKQPIDPITLKAVVDPASAPRSARVLADSSIPISDDIHGIPPKSV